MDIFITLKDFVIFSFRPLFLLSLSYHTPFKKKKKQKPLPGQGTTYETCDAFYGFKKK